MRFNEESPLRDPVSPFEIKMHSELKNRLEVPTRYEFLKGHNGLRPNCLHGIIGTTGCLSGDTTIRIKRFGMYMTKTLKELCILFGEYPGEERAYLFTKENLIRSYNPDIKEIELRKFIKVTYSGLKDIYEMMLENGKTLKATRCHEIMTDTGMRSLGSLSPGDDVLCDYWHLGTQYSKVISINYVGIEESFDVYEVHGTNNFTANDIVVSNCGKSTLFKCIIAETAADKRVLVWLSEENIVEYQELINFLDPECLANIKFVEEKEIAEEYKLDQKVFLEYFSQLVDESGAEFVFIDNVTSSCFYNQRFGFAGQNKSAEFLRNFVKTKCSIFYVSHTSTNVTDNYGKVVAPEDIRGSKELPIVTEYLYIIQKFTTNDKQYNLLRVAKFRHHQDAAGWFALTYENKSYIGDARIPFNLVNTIFKSRDYLGKKDAKTKS